MKNWIKLIPVLSLGILTSCAITNSSETITKTTEIEETTIDYDSITYENLSYRGLSEETNSYYSSLDTTLRGDSFIEALTPILKENYQRYGYDDIWEILASADEDPYNSSNVICQYTGKSIAKGLDSTSKGWNREHTWAKSHGFPQKSFDAFSDCHHLTATSNAVNSTRGDLDFGEVADYTGEVKTDIYGNSWITDLVYEPRDEVKGDVARMLFYMVARYNDSTLDLTLCDEIPTPQTSGTGSLGHLSTLLKWHYQDPVSDTEIRRNEIVYSYQKNRNPFIDHPEWVNYAFPSDYRKYLCDEDKVLAVIEDIQALPTLITLEEKEEVEEILATFSSLNPQEKLYVKNYPTLSKAKYQINYLENNQTLDDADIYYDFSTLTGTDFGYTNAYSFTLNDSSFYASCACVNSGEFRIGSNNAENQIDLSIFGIDGFGGYLRSNFSTKGLKGMTLEVVTYYKVDTVYFISLVEGEYKILYQEDVVDSTIAATFDSFDGQLIIAFKGSGKVRCAIGSLGLYID